MNDLLVRTNSHGRNTRFCQLNQRCPSYNRESGAEKHFPKGESHQKTCLQGLLWDLSSP